MSSGPGILQTQILNKLREKDSYIFQRILLWEIAVERSEIKKTGSLCLGIERGYIKKSFGENFRRAVKRLRETGKIEVKDEKLTDLDEALSYFPYHTSQLEIHQLRKKLIPSIVEYINENKPRKHWYYDIEKNQLSKIKRTQKFRAARRIWKRIQEKILLMLKEKDATVFDEWLECLVRGRYLFFGKKFVHSKFLVTFYDNFEGQKEKTVIEQETIKLLKNLIDSTFDKGDWDIRELKSVYYEIANFQKGYSDNLANGVKQYLRDKHKGLIISLPGHEEPEPPTPPKDSNSKWVRSLHRDLYMRNIEYSKYLDKLLTRQILKKHRQVKSI